eukprot:CAMPEP_0119479240 /NCGR_PEP_ID=MMETSP1344-20130328/8601_1 /TAXON_ID=236787 /ORGANISM="Florenciella parvula, Strain CCMP2471" /LENGTH=85 /DNA_ID=CAMNT_0007513457 /DNA_START=133 /DNA_END=387 /DNA_ORIENTATION=+
MDIVVPIALSVAYDSTLNPAPLNGPLNGSLNGPLNGSLDALPLGVPFGFTVIWQWSRLRPSSRRLARSWSGRSHIGFDHRVGRAS